MKRSRLLLALGLVASFGLDVARSDESDRIPNLLERAERAAQNQRHEEAVRLTTEAIADPQVDAHAFYLRGREQFRAGNVKASVADFDEYVKRRPESFARLWERGISCYYAGHYEAGAEQFSAYQTYHGNDVENAVWHLLCLSRVKGFNAARKELLTIQSDRRIPMMTIYRLFAGTEQPAAVLESARSGNPNKERLNHRLFYAHLYLGLYYEACGNRKLAATHISTAAEKHRIEHYMWDVARIHAKRLAPPTNSNENKTNVTDP